MFRNTDKEKKKKITLPVLPVSGMKQKTSL